MTTYRTGDVARSAGVHPNTVRFYEEIGFLSKPRRLPNNYRAYTALQLEQVKFVRLALRAEVLQGGLRKQVIRIIRLCADRHFDEALLQTEVYRSMLDREIEFALQAATFVETLLERREQSVSLRLTRREAAQTLAITVDTLRNWELNGLVSIRRMENGYRVYDGADLERLTIIRTLRQANYSLSAILNLMNRLSAAEPVCVLEALHAPDPGDDIRSVCDHLIEALENARADARRLPDLLNNLKEIETLQ